MTYLEVLACDVTRQEALQELRIHNVFDPVEFDSEMGVADTYRAADVLAWLGY